MSIEHHVITKNVGYKVDLSIGYDENYRLLVN